jgi:hypothetical protein
MWRLWNILFGWDYVYWRNSCDHGVARLHTTPNGKVWFYRYKITNVIDSVDEYVINKNIYIRSNIIFLTCHPSKYGY